MEEKRLEHPEERQDEKQEKKKRRRLDGNSKRLRRISAHSGKGQLADCHADGCSPLPAALAVAAEHGKPLCGWEEFFFSNCSVSSAGRRRGFPLPP